MLTSLICLWIGFGVGLVCAALIHANSIESERRYYRGRPVDYVI